MVAEMSDMRVQQTVTRTRVLFLSLLGEMVLILSSVSLQVCPTWCYLRLSLSTGFVGYDPALNTVVVSHQGTDTSEIIPIITDADFFLTSLDQTLFPGTSGLEVHNGFGDAQAEYVHIMEMMCN